MSQSKQTVKKKKDWAATGFLFSMLTVQVVNFFVFYVCVNFESIMLAFKLPNGTFSLRNFEWVFQDFVKEDSVMVEALINTLTCFFVDYVIMYMVALFLSYFLYKKIAGYKFFRVMFYIPSILSAVIMTTIFKTIIGPSGPVYQMLETISGTEPPEFFADSRYAMNAIIIYNCWVGFGGGTIILTGAMSRIPRDVLEAGLVDGISPVRELFSMIIPMVWPTISTQLITGLAGIFSASGPILLLTNGEYKTMTISFYIFDQVNRYNAYNEASAIGFIYTLIGIPIVLGGRWLCGRIQEDVEY
ncbi:MAG: sugar ABC transporter permease [Clostridia bacterium]|nr:sugar ABC transporter permease [Clostridia bacterium]